jgi:cobalt-zinc-cadmium efflux system membrane fusion protein
MRPNHRLRAATLGLMLATAPLALSLTACHRANAGADAGAMFTDDHGLLTVPAASPLRTHMTVRPVNAGAAGAGVDLPAAVEADPARVANVLAPLTGRVVALKVAIGDHVHQGQVLAVLASGDFAQARSDEDKARDAFELAKRALERAKGVQDAGGAAVKDLEAATSAYNQAEAELNRAQTRMGSLNGGAGHGRDLVLTAPQTGVVTAMAVGLGSQVNDPTAVLMTVSNLDRVYVTANVPENQIGRISVGAGADISLSSDPTHPVHARVSEVNAVVEPDTRRQKVRMALANPGWRLMPNMYATVRLTEPSAGGVYVPQSALLMNNDVTSVLVEVRPWVFQRRPVKIGDETEAAARVLSGLAPGDRVVVRGGVLLND